MEKVYKQQFVRCDYGHTKIVKSTQILGFVFGLTNILSVYNFFIIN